MNPKYATKSTTHHLRLPAAAITHNRQATTMTTQCIWCKISLNNSIYRLSSHILAITSRQFRRIILIVSLFSQFRHLRLSGFSILIELVQKLNCRAYPGPEKISAALRHLIDRVR